MSLNILYMSTHAVLEYDEIRLLDELGYNVTSIGAYITPLNPHVDIRPPLNIKHNIEFENKIHHMFNLNKNNGIELNMCSKVLNKDVLNDYDVVIVMEKIDWIELNWEVLKNKIVILRTIGQSNETVELKIKKYLDKGISVIRYSPSEQHVKNFAGQSILIRFLKYQSDFKNRSHTPNNKLISIGQDIKNRKDTCFGNIIEEVATRLNFILYGTNNENYNFYGGNISYYELIDILSISGCYLYTGTYPAPYTLNFIEALMSGIPIISIGHEWYRSKFYDYNSEVPAILNAYGINCANNINDIISLYNKFTQDPNYATETSFKQIDIASKMFSVEQNKYKWKEYIESL